MKTFLKIVGGLIAFSLISLAVLLVFFPTPVVPESELVAKYGQAPSQMLRLPSGTVAHYRDYAPANDNAAAPVIVLLHGSNSSLHTWEPWAQRLKTTMRVVTVDLPGHGLTGATVENDYSPEAMVAFVENFTRALGLNHPFVLAGNSMGGHLAWRYTLAHPERVSKLVLLDAGGVALPGPEPTPPLAFRLARNPITAPMVRRLAPRSLFASAILKSFYNKSLVTDPMIDRYWELNRRKGTADATLARFRLPRFDAAMQARIHEIAVPTMILWGREDELIPVATADVLAKTIPGARVIIYDHCGHIPMEEVPDRSATDVRAFVEGGVVARN